MTWPAAGGNWEGGFIRNGYLYYHVPHQGWQVEKYQPHFLLPARTLWWKRWWRICLTLTRPNAIL